jgi:internalin A
VEAKFTDQHPVIVDGRTLVPVRGVFETLGFEVDWDNKTQQATLINEEYTIELTIGNESFTTNGENHTLNVPAQIIGSSVMLPIRDVLESVDYNLDWDSHSNTVIITNIPAPGYEPGSVRLNWRGMTNEQLAGMVESGEIPADVTTLFLDGNQLSDLTPLSGLTSLAFLRLSYNDISDISPVSGLTNLTHLDLSGNKISDLFPLSELTNLTFLSLGGNHINDLSPLREMTCLEILHLMENQITNVNPLSKLVNLSELYLYSNQIKDIAPLRGLTSYLDLYDNPITDWSPIDRIENINGRPVSETLLQIQLDVVNVQ